MSDLDAIPVEDQGNFHPAGSYATKPVSDISLTKQLREMEELACTLQGKIQTMQSLLSDLRDRV